MNFTDFLEIFLNNPIEVIIASIVIYIFFSVSQIGIKYLKYIALDRVKFKEKNDFPKYVRIMNFIIKEMTKTLNIIANKEHGIRSYITTVLPEGKIDLVVESTTTIFSPCKLEGNDIVIFEDFLKDKTLNSIIARYGAQDLIVRKVIVDERTYYIVVELGETISQEERYCIDHKLIALETLVKVYDEIKRLGEDV